jgi:hemerythrin-like domain-containing protein
VLREHEAVCRCVEALTAAVRVHTNDGGSPDTLIANANDFASIVRRHITNEDRALFPIAESILSDKERRQLAQQFERLNNEGRRRAEPSTTV